MKPFSTYPEDRQKLLNLAQTILDQYPSDDSYKVAADALADLVKVIITDEQFVIDADADLSLTDEMKISDGWETFKAAAPVAKVINDNQPGKTAIIEILSDPPTLAVGTMLFAAPQPSNHGASDRLYDAMRSL